MIFKCQDTAIHVRIWRYNFKILQKNVRITFNIRFCRYHKKMLKKLSSFLHLTTRDEFLKQKQVEA